MARKIVAICALVVFAGGLVAGEYRGRVKSVDTKEGTITVTTGRRPNTQDKTIKIAKDCKFTSMNKELADKLATEGLKHEIFTKTGQMAPTVVVKTEGEGDKEVAKEITVNVRRRPNQ